MPLRFTIRALLWLTLVVALVLKWSADSVTLRRVSRERASYLAQTEQMTELLNDRHKQIMQLEEQARKDSSSATK
jgi:hypothetical protein